MQEQENLRDFNSNMVRLKGYVNYFITLTFNLFQFQYGSIKRNSNCHIKNVVNRFQFQYGSIKRSVSSDTDDK